MVHEKTGGGRLSGAVHEKTGGGRFSGAVHKKGGAVGSRDCMRRRGEGESLERSTRRPWRSDHEKA